jgi:hypothetical protein
MADACSISIKGTLKTPTLLLLIVALLSHSTCVKFTKFNSHITLSIATRGFCVYIFVVQYDFIFNARTGSTNILNNDASLTIM